ncbi:MAG TPA: RT0821/Lpp0805 family surface protein [Candidatus Sulfotelmatobacter sp.]|nr:RT0821/Lpp0805 family surface protein [Candidatus Sulfotelmatobacter sp.]
MVSIGSLKTQLSALALAALIAGCSATPGASPTRVGDACSDLGWGTIAGAAVGATAGGLIGSQVGHGTGNALATTLGVVGGGLLGGAVGSRIDEADCLRAQRAQQAALARSTPIGQQITWSNPSNGTSGSFTPTREGQSASGQYCREYEQTIYVGGETKRGYGRACLQPDGSWQIQPS